MKKIYFLRYSLLVLFTCLANWVFAQTGTISGRVVDETSQPLPGATVVVKGTKIKTGSDVSGYFKLANVPNGAQVLVVSFIGYNQLEQPVNIPHAQSITLQLTSSSVLLNQVAVIGYGTVKKADATGAVDVITAKDFNKGSVNSIQEAIAGKLPGVVITSNSGAPGNTSTIRIRGTTSISASTDPLIVIDGVPISNILIGGTSNILNAINPDDIENITVLKDASATAIYGSRGSSGVILITTKHGTKKLTLNYSTTQSLSVLKKEVPVYTGDQFRALINDPATFYYPGQQQAAQKLLGKANTNWQDQIYHQAYGDDQNLSIAGTTKNMPYRVAIGYDDADGILKTYNYKRATAAINLDPSFFHNTLNVHVSLKGLYNLNNFADQAAIYSAVNYDPTQPVYNGNTKYRGYTSWTTGGPTDINGNPVTLATANPVARLDETNNTSTQRRSIGDVQFDYKIPGIDGLRANLNLGYDYSLTFGKNNVRDSTQWVYNPVPLGGKLSNYNTVNRNTVSEFYLNYKKDLKSISSVIDATAGTSYSYYYSNGNAISSDVKRTLTTTNPYKSYYTLLSYFGRVNYTFQDKYELTFTIRDDGTSKFSPKNRFGVFPAGAFAWKIMKESFMAGSSTFSDLKLRLGYGTTGQQDFGAGFSNYPYQANFDISDQYTRYQLGNNFYYTFRPSGYDANIKWESTTTANIGLDFGFFNNRLTGSLDFYNKNTSNLLNTVNVPVLTNFTATLIENIGKMNNKGGELGLNAIIIQQKDWRWQLGYNISYNKNTITSLIGSTGPGFIQYNYGTISGATSGYIQGNAVGHPYNSFLVFQQIYDKNGKPIENGYVDRDGNGILNSNDNYFDHSPDPKVTMGINSDIGYKKFDLSFSGRVYLGNYNYNNVESGATYGGFYSSLGYLSNQSTTAGQTKFTNPIITNQSDYYIENASFFKMDFINLGYTFPPKYLNNKLKLRLSAGVQNVFTITSYKGLDPEIQGGLDNNFFPRARIYQLGVNATF